MNQVALPPNYGTMVKGLKMKFLVPGKKFHYSTHAFTLVAAVIESVTGEPFDRHMSAKFKELGLANTRLDENGPIVYDRCRYLLSTFGADRSCPAVFYSY